MARKKQRNSPHRADMLAERIRLRRQRTGRAQFMPARPSLSRRGKIGQPWLNKKHTPSRLKDRAEQRG